MLTWQLIVNKEHHQIHSIPTNKLHGTLSEKYQIQVGSSLMQKELEIILLYHATITSTV